MAAASGFLAVTKRKIILALLAGWLIGAVIYEACAETGDTWLNIHGLSNHLDTDVWIDKQGQAHEWQEFNYGLGVTYEWLDHIELRGGAFRNSFDKGSVYAAAGLHTSYARLLSFSLQAGLATGYKDTPTGGDSALVGFIMPTAGINIKRTRIEIGYIPRANGSKGDSSVVTLSLAIKL